MKGKRTYRVTLRTGRGLIRSWIVLGKIPADLIAKALTRRHPKGKVTLVEYPVYETLSQWERANPE